MTYLSGTTTELVRRNDILHMAFSRFDLFDRGWTEQQIKYDLGTPDFRVRVGRGTPARCSTGRRRGSGRSKPV